MRTFLRSRSIRLATALAVASGTAGLATLTGLTGASAQADPVSTSAEIAVGSDVTQDLYSALSGASAPDSPNTTFYTPLHATSANNNTTIQSFDAFPLGGSTVNPGCVTTKIGGPSFDRPNSTTAGITALLATLSGSGYENTSASCTNALVDVTGQIQFARAARGPASTGSTLTFVPFARDGVAYLYFDHGTSNAASLTTAQLASIYSSTTASFTLPGGDVVKGCMTIAGSTPRKNLETAIAVSDSTATTEATAAGCNSIQQNSGNAFWNFAKNLPTGTDAIIPISAGDWIAQANGVAVDESNQARNNGLDLGSVTDGSTVLGKPYSGTVPNLAPRTTYYQSTSYGYNLFTVIPSAYLSGFTEKADLVDMFVNTATLPTNNAALCSTANQTTVHQFGFDSLTSAEGSCGSTTTTGNS